MRSEPVIVLGFSCLLLAAYASFDVASGHPAEDSQICNVTGRLIQDCGNWSGKMIAEHFNGPTMVSRCRAGIRIRVNGRRETVHYTISERLRPCSHPFEVINIIIIVFAILLVGICIVYLTKSAVC